MASPNGDGASTVLARRHPQRAVEPDRLAVQHLVLDDVHAPAPRTRPAGRAAAGTGSERRAASRASCGSAASSGVSNVPGAIVMTRMPRLGEIASRGQRQADDAALRRRVGDLPDLSVEGGDRSGVDADAALVASSGSLSFIAAAAKRSTLNVPIRLIRSTVSNGMSWCGPRLDAVRSAQPTPAQQTLMRSRARRLARPRRPPPRPGLVGDVARDEPGALAQLAGERLALLLVDVGDRDVGARARAARARSPRPARDAPPATSRSRIPSVFTAATAYKLTQRWPRASPSTSAWAVFSHLRAGAGRRDDYRAATGRASRPAAPATSRRRC